MKVSGKTFLVTGGGSGIGQAVVLRLLEQGGTVAAADLRPAGLDATVGRAARDGARLSTHVVDVADGASVRALYESVLECHGCVDGILNVAGIIQPFRTLLQLDDATIARVMNVNFYGTLNVVRAFLPHLLERPEAHVVNVSSMGGFLPVPGQAIYCASKAAVKLLTEALYAELLDTNVRVTAVFPGAVATNIAENSGVEIAQDEEAASKGLTPAEAAATIIEGMEDDAYHVLAGSDAYIMDKLSRLMPERALRIIQKRMASLLADE